MLLLLNILLHNSHFISKKHIKVTYKCMYICRFFGTEKKFSFLVGFLQYLCILHVYRNMHYNVFLAIAKYKQYLCKLLVDLPLCR